MSACAKTIEREARTMTVTAHLDANGLAVEPGQLVTVDLTVRNTGHRVEAYQLDVVGEMAVWAAIDPPRLSLYPGDEARAHVTFTPPRAATALAGPRPFGVRVVPRDHPEDSSVPEGTGELRPFADLTAELTPPPPPGRRR